MNDKMSKRGDKMISNFTKNLKDERIRRNFTQKEIAEILKITRQQYSLYETGQRTMPLEQIVKLAKLYDISIDYLVGIETFRNPYPKK